MRRLRRTSRGATRCTRALSRGVSPTEEIAAVGIQILVGKLLNETIGPIIGIAHSILIRRLRRLQGLLLLLLRILLLLSVLLLCLRRVWVGHEVTRRIGWIGGIDIVLGPLSLIDGLGKSGGGGGICATVCCIIVSIIVTIV